MFSAKKELGQNFLSDRGIVNSMIDALELKYGEDVIEIGPGHGIFTEVLTDRLGDTGAKVFAVELDERFCAKLETMFLENENTYIVCENILDYLPAFKPDRKFKILGSLPYYITSPILHKIIKMEILPENCVLLVQKEVAEKIKDKAPDSTYMSSFVQTFFDINYLGRIEAEKFNPVPEVDGGIIKLVKKSNSYSPKFIEKYEGFLHKAYSHPRKMLNKVFTKDELEMGEIKPNLRAQNLDSIDWVKFFKVLHKYYEI